MEQDLLGQDLGEVGARAQVDVSSERALAHARGQARREVADDLVARRRARGVRLARADLRARGLVEPREERVLPASEGAGRDGAHVGARQQVEVIEPLDVVLARLEQGGARLGSVDVALLDERGEREVVLDEEADVALLLESQPEAASDVGDERDASLGVAERAARLARVVEEQAESEEIAAARREEQLLADPVLALGRRRGEGASPPSGAAGWPSSAAIAASVCSSTV